MAAKKPSQGTGRYVWCPRSGHDHAWFAAEVKRGEKSLWFTCVCGFRGYWPKMALKPPRYTREYILSVGGIIPTELASMPIEAFPLPTGGLPPGPPQPPQQQPPGAPRRAQAGRRPS